MHIPILHVWLLSAPESNGSSSIPTPSHPQNTARPSDRTHWPSRFSNYCGDDGSAVPVLSAAFFCSDITVCSEVADTFGEHLSNRVYIDRVPS
jgi:hypothetical protein